MAAASVSTTSPTLASTSPSGGRARLADLAVWLAPTVLALGLSAYRSSVSRVWVDEYATFAHAALDLPGLFAAVARVDAVFGPYYLLMHVLAPVLGTAGPWFRLPSIIAFAVATALVAVLARRWWGRLAALAAGLAFAVNPALLEQSVNARPYTLSVMFLLGAVLALDIAMGGSKRRAAWVTAAVAGALAVAMHLFAVLALATTVVLLLGRRHAIRPWLLAAAPSAILAAVFYLVGSGHRGQLTWLPTFGVRDTAAVLASTAGVGPADGFPFHVALLAMLFAVLVLAAIATAPARKPVDGDVLGSVGWNRARPVLFSGVLFVGPWLVLAIGSWLVSPMLIDRYVIWSAAGAALVIGAGVHVGTRVRTPVSLIAAVLSVALLVVSAGLSVQQTTRLHPQAGDLDRVVEVLGAQARPGDRIALVQRYWEGGVATEFATALDDESYAAAVISRLPAGGQPFVEQRRVSSVEPLRTESDSVAPVAGDVVWLLTIIPLTDEDLDSIDDPRLAACLADVPPVPTERVGGHRLTRVVCGRG